MGKRIGAAKFKRDRPTAELNPVEKKKRRSIIGAMKGSVLRYDRPFDPAIEPDEWAKE